MTFKISKLDISGGVGAVNIQERLKELRKSVYLNQEDIANVLGVSKQTYGRYERGERTLSPGEIVLLARFYNVTTDYLLGVTDDPAPK